MSRTLRTTNIAGREIGADHPPYVIAELSANHLGDLDRALRIMEASAKAGVDAMKLQTYTADTITLDVEGPGFRIEGGLWDGYTLYDLYDRAHMPWEWHERLFEEGRNLGIAVFSSPFDFSAVDYLESLGAPAYKIASFELIDLPLVRHAAQKGKPLVMSRGMSGLGQVSDAIEVARAHGSGEVILLHCVSGYPAPSTDSNLRTIPHLADAFDAIVGLSDHTLGTAVSVAAVALGAAAIEKHVTLSRADGGPDSAFSLEPDELARLVTDCRAAWQAVGEVNYGLKESEKGNVQFRRSLYIVCDMEAGDALTKENLRSIRPGFGLPPTHYDDLIGRRIRRPVKRGTPMSWELLA